MYVFLAGQIVWSLVILYAALAKLNVYGVPSFLKHVTNWAWVLQGIFYLVSATVFAPSPQTTSSCCNVRCAGNVVFWLFFPMNQIIWYVFVAVVMLLAIDPDFITDMFSTVAPGIVIIGNDVFHTWPVLAVALYVAAQHRLIWYGQNRWLAPAHEAGPCALFWALAYQVTGGALLFAGAYFAVLSGAYHTTVNDVYETEFPFAAGFLLFVAVGFIVNGIPLLMLVCCYGVLERPRSTAAAAERRAYDPLYTGCDDDVVPARTLNRLQAALTARRGALNYNVFTG